MTDEKHLRVEGTDECDDRGHRSGTMFRSWMATLPPETWTFLFYFACAVFLTWPLVLHMNTSVYGHHGDNMGSIWNLWWFRNHGSFGGATFSTNLLGFPFQSSLGMPIEPLGYLYWRFLLLFMNEVIAWNVDTILGFFLSGVTMYYLVRYIARDRRVAAFAGFAYLFGVYHAAYAAYVGAYLGATQWMPLYILCLLKFLDEPRWKTAVYLGASGILVAGMSVHYGLFMAVFTGAFLAGKWLYDVIASAREAGGFIGSVRRGLTVNKRTALMSLAALLAVVVVVLPLFYAFVASYGRPAQWPTGPLPSELRIQMFREISGAVPVQYAAPNAGNPVLGTVGEKMLEGTLYIFGNTSYVGWSILALSLACPFAWWRKRRRRKDRNASSESGPEVRPDDPPGARCVKGARGILWGFAAGGLAGFLFSLRPHLDIGGLRIPTPTVVLGKVAPWFRWYNRFAIVVAMSLIVIASFTVYRLLLLRRQVIGRAVVLAIAAFLAVEMVLVPPFKRVDFATIPPVFDRVSELGEGEAVAYYPMKETGLFITSLLMFYQRYTGKPMLNGATPNSDGEAMRRTVYSPYDPATPGVLKRLGINYAVLFEGQIEGAGAHRLDPDRLPTGFEELERFKSDRAHRAARLYRVAGPPADMVPLYLDNISIPVLDNEGDVTRLVDGTGIIRILNFSGTDRTVTFRLPVASRFSRQRVSLALPDGRVLLEATMDRGKAGIAELRNLLIPEEGLDLEIRTEGASHYLSSSEVSIYGLLKNSIEIDSVELVAINHE